MRLKIKKAKKERKGIKVISGKEGHSNFLAMVNAANNGRNPEKALRKKFKKNQRKKIKRKKIKRKKNLKKTKNALYLLKAKSQGKKFLTNFAKNQAYYARNGNPNIKRTANKQFSMSQKFFKTEPKEIFSPLEKIYGYGAKGSFRHFQQNFGFSENDLYSFKTEEPSFVPLKSPHNAQKSEISQKNKKGQYRRISSSSHKNKYSFDKTHPTFSKARGKSFKIQGKNRKIFFGKKSKKNRVKSTTNGVNMGRVKSLGSIREVNDSKMYKDTILEIFQINLDPVKKFKGDDEGWMVKEEKFKNVSYFFLRVF